MLSKQHSHRHRDGRGTQGKGALQSIKDSIVGGHDQHMITQTGTATRFVEANIETPKYEMPQREMTAAAAYQIIHDEMQLNANPNMNLASFVTTWMEPEATKLMNENINVNLADQNVYPQCTELQHRCVNMIAHLFHSREERNAVGSATIGSSEGLMLGLLALLGKWRDREKKRTGKDPLEEVDANGKIRKPNYIVSASSHVTVLKFGRYFNTETRVVPFEPGQRHLTVDSVLSRIDENTIGIVSVIGTQLTGEVDNVKELHDAVVDFCQNKKKWDFVVPFHIDGASGGFILPFTRPDFVWDFRLPHVHSVQVSGHKYGLVYPGIGWVIWRSKDHLPNDLIFHINYLGSDEPTFTLNFSRPATQILGQYYNFLRLGYAGYERIAKQCLDNAKYLQAKLEQLGYFDFFSDLDKPCLPLVAFAFKEKYNFYEEDDLVNGVKLSGWTLPKYTLPKNLEHITIFRVVVRESFTRDLADYLVHDIVESIHSMERRYKKWGVTSKAQIKDSLADAQEAAELHHSLSSSSISESEVEHHDTAVPPTAAAPPAAGAAGSDQVQPATPEQRTGWHRWQLHGLRKQVFRHGKSRKTKAPGAKPVVQTIC